MRCSALHRVRPAAGITEEGAESCPGLALRAAPVQILASLCSWGCSMRLVEGGRDINLLVVLSLLVAVMGGGRLVRPWLW